mmetsp:Transcript_35286/g.112248  ORF Transcript_35286/g.112248 Transcript_35286/m.112248 type:complete len:308 (-) Transcript_35286:87-1010(-)
MRASATGVRGPPHGTQGPSSTPACSSLAGPLAAASSAVAAPAPTPAPALGLATASRAAPAAAAHVTGCGGCTRASLRQAGETPAVALPASRSAPASAFAGCPGQMPGATRPGDGPGACGAKPGVAPGSAGDSPLCGAGCSRTGAPRSTALPVQPVASEAMAESAIEATVSSSPCMLAAPPPRSRKQASKSAHGPAARAAACGAGGSSFHGEAASSSWPRRCCARREHRCSCPCCLQPKPRRPKKKPRRLPQRSQVSARRPPGCGTWTARPSAGVSGSPGMAQRTPAVAEACVWEASRSRRPAKSCRR